MELNAALCLLVRGKENKYLPNESPTIIAFTVRGCIMVVSKGNNDVFFVCINKGLTPLSLGEENWRRPVVFTTSDRMAVWKTTELYGRFHRALVG